MLQLVACYFEWTASHFSHWFQMNDFLLLFSLLFLPLFFSLSHPHTNEKTRLFVQQFIITTIEECIVRLTQNTSNLTPTGFSSPGYNKWSGNRWRRNVSIFSLCVYTTNLCLSIDLCCNQVTDERLVFVLLKQVTC